MSFKDWFTQEYDRDLEQRIKRAMKISISEKDRAQTRDFLVSYMRMHPARVRAPKKNLNWSFHPYAIIAGLLIVALGGSSAGAASLAEQALPGDLLYPIKVNINEEVRAALATTPEKKADVALARAEKRINELNTLAARGELSEEVRAEIDNRIDEHVHDAEIETVLAENGGREQRLVAMLRVHENLIATSEMGGGIEPDVSIAALMATDATPSTNKNYGNIETMSMTVTSLEESEFAPTQAPEGEDVSRTAVVAEPEIPTMFEAGRSAKNISPEIDKKPITRLKKAAEQRIESLEKLLKGKGGRVETLAVSHAQNEIAAAKTAYAEGLAFFEAESLGDATVRFNAAIRIAIDAREFLSDAPKAEDNDREHESRGSGRNRGRDDD
jgi:hypothetical protein